MRSRWEGVRADLLRSVATLPAEQRFKGINIAILSRFESPAALVRYLNDPGGDPDDKNAIYGALLRAVQAHGHWSEMATALLWLGLWPGLDAIYRRRLKWFVRQPEALVSEIGSQFTEAIARADLSRVHRVAATLVMNTERDVVRGLVERWKKEKDEDDLEDDEVLAKRKRARPFETPADALENLNVICLTEQIDRVAAGDRELLHGVLLLGESQREAAARLGIPYDAARKRFQRALARVQKEIEADAVPFSVPNRRFLSEERRR